MWDTGATNTVIHPDIAKAIGLAPTGRATVTGVNQTIDVNKYLVNIFLPNSVGIVGVSVTEGNLKGCKVLIGMDIIGMGDFAVTNVKETVMSFRIPSTKSIDFEDRLNFSFGRNQKVKIRNTETGKTKTIKWKKAEDLVETGQWEVCIKDD